MKKSCYSAHFELGRLYYYQGKYTPALRHFEKSSEKLKHLPLIHYYTGMTYMELNNSYFSEKALKKALKLEKGDKDEIYYALYCHAKRFDFQKNISEYKQKIGNQEKYFDF